MLNIEGPTSHFHIVARKQSYSQFHNGTRKQSYCNSSVWSMIWLKFLYMARYACKAKLNQFQIDFIFFKFSMYQVPCQV